ncbi:unnamed protein product [Amoebophrya sp. A120]|nr:unnamed protein product [Amoebophrya sp. A120]|eukprot:GSA120T00024258001.1
MRMPAAILELQLLNALLYPRWSTSTTSSRTGDESIYHFYSVLFWNFIYLPLLYFAMMARRQMLRLTSVAIRVFFRTRLYAAAGVYFVSLITCYRPVVALQFVAKEKMKNNLGTGEAKSTMRKTAAKRNKMRRDDGTALGSVLFLQRKSKQDQEHQEQELGRSGREMKMLEKKEALEKTNKIYSEEAATSSCAPTGERCGSFQRCCVETETCYEKDEWWESCLPHGSCTPGAVQEGDPIEYRTPWRCKVIGTPGKTSSSGGQQTTGMTTGLETLPSSGEQWQGGNPDQTTTHNNDGHHVWGQKHADPAVQDGLKQPARDNCASCGGGETPLSDERAPATAFPARNPHNGYLGAQQVEIVGGTSHARGIGGVVDPEAANAASLATRAAVDELFGLWEGNEQARNAATQQLIDQVKDHELDRFVLGGGWGERVLNGQYAFVGLTQSVDSIGFEGLTYMDGPQGFRTSGYDGSLHDHGLDKDAAIMFPGCGAVGQAWDPEYATVYGYLLAETFHVHGAQLILGPGVQFHHHPLNGRNFEYLPGEDPVIGVVHTESMVRAMTARGVLSNLKHYIGNDWEVHRNDARSNVVIPDEAHMELYLKPFVAGIAAGSQSVMCGYNQVEGVPCCAQGKILNWLNSLSDRFYVLTDWVVHNPNSQYKATDYLTAGLHQEQPAKGSWGPDNGAGKGGVQNMLDVGSAPAALKRKAGFRILAAAQDGHQLDKQDPLYLSRQKQAQVFPQKPNAATYEDWRHLTKMLAVDILVLLENRNNLLPLAPTQKVKVDHSCTEEKFQIAGGGSGSVGGCKQVFPAEALKAAGMFAEEGDSSTKLKLYCLSTDSREGQDRDLHKMRDAFTLPGHADLSNAIVFVSAPGAVPTSGFDQAAAVLFSIYPGQLAGHALVDVLMGTYQPSGHLHLTLFDSQDAWGAENKPDPYSYNDPWNPGNGVEMGYRRHQQTQYDEHKNVKYHFGYGLAFRPWDPATVHAYVSTWDADVRSIRLCVQNKMSADDPQFPIVSKPSPVVQVYVQLPGRNFKELLTFAKFHEVTPGTEVCKLVLYDPIAVYNSAEGKFEVPGSGSLPKVFLSLNGVQEAGADISGSIQAVGLDRVKKSFTLKEYFHEYRKRAAARVLLDQDANAKPESPGITVADQVGQTVLDGLVGTWLTLAKRSTFTTQGTGYSYGLYALQITYLCPHLED